MKKDLFICNTVYQVLVAMWIKKTLFRNSIADIIISDHMNKGKEICERMKQSHFFDNCFFCETKDFSYGGFWKEVSDSDTSLLIHRHPERYIKRFFKSDCKYKRLFMSNVDKFAQVLYEACSRVVRTCKLYLFEDGISTYTKLFEKYYYSTQREKPDILHHLVYKYIYNKRSIFGNVKGCYLFNPELFDWSADFQCIEIQKIDTKDVEFIKTCNFVFNYNNQDCYDTKYIFLEESFFADGVHVNDCEIVEQIAAHVGKKNIMVKIHPRNPVNRFKELGYKTNNNTSIPWELIIMNNPDICNKNLITIASTSMLNPILIFGKKIKGYSIFELVNEESKSSSYLSTELWGFVKQLFNRYNDQIFIVNKVGDIL